MTRVSVIMSTGGNRLPELHRTLQSWSKATHPDFDFNLVLNDYRSDEVENFVGEFKFITGYRCTNAPPVVGNIIWTTEAKRTRGDYVVFAMADELLGSYDLLERMENEVDKSQRASVLTYYTDEVEKNLLDGIDWLDNPKMIEDLPSFWTHLEVDFTPNLQKISAELTTHITGATREYWDWIGWFREDAIGYLNLDTDLVLRERFLGKHPVTVGCCYHQWHPRAFIPQEHRLPAYIYETEEQARLLSPARRGE